MSKRTNTVVEFPFELLYLNHDSVDVNRRDTKGRLDTTVDLYILELGCVITKYNIENIQVGCYYTDGEKYIHYTHADTPQRIFITSDHV